MNTPRKSIHPRLIFPLFNGLVGAIFGGLIGYYIFKPLEGLLWGVLCGLTIGLVAEFSLHRLGAQPWLYRRRVWLIVMLEIPLAILVLGPYVYAVANTLPANHVVCCETPLDYGASTYEEVEINTQDGVTLVGWYVPPPQAAGAVIVLLHGSGSDRRGTAWHARQLIQAGYGILMYDQRATGESRGDKTYMGWREGADLLSVLEFLQTRAEVDFTKIGVVGLSAGGHSALNAAYIQPERMAALWLDGVQAQRIKDFPIAQNSREQVAWLMNAMILKMIEIHLRQTAPPAFVDILAQLEEPEVMLVAGGLNDFERRVNLQYSQVLPSNAELWLIEDAWHMGGHAVIPDDYCTRMLEFFSAAFDD